jgi:hypothetical protein
VPDYAASVQAVGLRITKLDATGAPATSATSSYTTKAFTKFSWTPEYEEGEEIKTVAADGTTCVYYKMPDTLKEVQVELEMCNPQPEVYEMLAGGSILVGATSPTYTITNKALTTNVATLTTSATHALIVGDRVVVTGVDATFNGTYTVTAVTGTTFSYAKTAANVVSGAATGTAIRGDNTGWASPAIGAVSNPNGVSIEVWSRAIVAGRPAAVNPYWRWVMPFMITRLEGDRTLENGALANVFSGKGLGNAAWNDGPANDWSFGSNSALMFNRDSSAVTTEGYFTVIP